MGFWGKLGAVATGGLSKIAKPATIATGGLNKLGGGKAATIATGGMNRVARKVAGPRRMSRGR